jgi:hypothetical protein
LARRPLRQHLPRERQHGRIAEMKEHDGREEHHQVAPLQERREWRGYSGAVCITQAFTAARELVVDFGPTDKQDRDRTRGSEHAHEPEKPHGSRILAEYGGQHSRGYVACVIEALVAADARSQHSMPNYSEAQCGNAGTHDSGDERERRLRCEDDRQRRTARNQETAGRDDAGR